MLHRLAEAAVVVVVRAVVNGSGESCRAPLCATSKVMVTTS